MVPERGDFVPESNGRQKQDLPAKPGPAGFCGVMDQMIRGRRCGTLHDAVGWFANQNFYFGCNKVFPYDRSDGISLQTGMMK
jgi:hypothetical protein